MEVIFKDPALDDIEFWKKSGNLQVQKKISELINDILLHPETGIGKPEPLKYQYAGCWSRHITKGHRIVYEIVNNQLHILSLKGHYS